MQILSYHDRRQQNSFMLDIIVSWTKPSYALELLGPDVNIAELSSNKIIDSESYELYRFLTCLLAHSTHSLFWPLFGVSLPIKISRLHGHNLTGDEDRKANAIDDRWCYEIEQWMICIDK